MLQVFDSCYGLEVTSIDWTLVWTFISTIFVGVGVVVGLWQLRDVRRSLMSQSYAQISTILQSQDVREARGKILNPEKRGSLSHDDLKKTIEIVASTYDMVGKMLRRSGVGYAQLSEDWQRSIRKCWHQCKDLVLEYRKERGNDFWRDFELLYNAAQEFYDNHPEVHEPGEPNACR